MSGSLLAVARRRAFTLIELLVVIAIIAVLIGLLLPAVQKVREASAKTQCSNNLKQIGVGMHAYHDANGSLAPGLILNKVTQPIPGWGWHVLILPYIEQAALYSTLKPDLATPNGPPNPPGATNQLKLKVFTCPSDPGNDVPNSWYGNYGVTNYVCNRAVLGPDNATTSLANMRLTDITDGTSNTLLVGERDTYHTFGGVWGAAWHNTKSTASFEGRPGKGLNSPYKANGPFPPVATDDPFNYAQRLEFSSMHSHIVGFVFADGSVHMINDSIDADPSDIWDNANWANTTNFTLQNLYWPQDRNTVKESAF